MLEGLEAQGIEDEDRTTKRWLRLLSLSLISLRTAVAVTSRILLKISLWKELEDALLRMLATDGRLSM
jgi:hypothetical protein